MSEVAGRAPLTELTYTSFDSPTTQRGGWQVKELRVDDSISSAERDEYEHQLVGRISTFLVPVEPLPKFPSAENLAGRVRRLVYLPLSDSLAGLWHTVEAGIDGSGRPGNVFCHAVMLDRRNLDARAIDLWRSPGWLTPHGPTHVAAASLGPSRRLAEGAYLAVDGPGDPVAFLSETTALPMRIALMGAVLDAAAEVMAGGSKLLLLAESPDHAAQWISIICGWTSCDVANRISWSTYERAEDLDSPMLRDLDIVAVPVQDREQVMSADHGRFVVALDDESYADFYGNPDEPWTYGTGDTLAKTPWSLMAMNAATAAEPGESIMAALRRVKGESSLGSPEKPGAALARYLLDQGSTHLDFARREAKLAFPLADLCEQRDSSVDAAAEYVVAALVDDEWLARDGGAPVPALPVRLSPDVDKAVRGRAKTITEGLAVLEQRIRARSDSGVDRGLQEELSHCAARSLRFADFMAKTHLVDKNSHYPELIHLVRWRCIRLMKEFPEQLRRQDEAACEPLDSDTESRGINPYREDSESQTQPEAQSLDQSQLQPGLHNATAVLTPVSPKRSEPPDWGRHNGPRIAVGRKGSENEPGATQIQPWLLKALGWGNLGGEISDRQRSEAREVLEEIGLGRDPFFMSSSDVHLRPHEEVVALAVLASMTLSRSFPNAGKRLRDSQPKLNHLQQTARKLLDAGARTEPRTADSAASLMIYLTQIEQAIGEPAGDLSNDRSPYARLLRDLVDLDEANDKRLKRLYQGDDGNEVRDRIRKCETGRFVAEVLGVPVPDRGRRRRSFLR